ncbi:AAA domain-containing protein [Yoonia sp. SS1-5]|uniref:AAA domain-containing protein n=1 Tax=Yoonia rhodophyticola TaxID=3137370 RepID=A0AAN0MD87_9RHOB
MKQNLQNALSYWRSSLADSALGNGRFRNSDRKDFIELSKETLATGILPKNQVAEVFRREEADVKVTAVQLWPMVTARKTSHGATISDGFPDLVAPVVTAATIDRDGTIRPSNNVIARDLLTPLPGVEYALGSMDDFDAFYAASPFSPDENSPLWAQYLKHCRAILDAVAPEWPANDNSYISTGVGFLKRAGTASSSIGHVIGLYDAVLREEPEMPLLDQLAFPTGEDLPLSTETEANFINRLGHSSNEFPLAARQRQSLSYVSRSKTGDVLAVNGPPGTGKTTLLLSVIADAWVRAAHDQTEPPVIVAASTNNQAVTNIIDAFGENFSTGEGPFAGRWIPQLKSYGLYLPSKTLEAKVAHRYQTDRFFRDLETEEGFAKAQEAFLAAGRDAFPGHDEADLEEIVRLLHQEIVKEVSNLTRAERARAFVEQTTAKVSRLLGDNPVVALSELEQEAQAAQATSEQYKNWETSWHKHQADESLFLGLFGFLPPVARKRMARARVALDAIGCSLALGDARSIFDIGTAIQKAVDTAGKAEKAAEQAFKDAKTATADLEKAKRDWQSAVENLDFPADQLPTPKNVDAFADCNARFRLFRLATHYWEARWLLSMAEDLKDITTSHKKSGRKRLEPRWRRRMMLTPCAVSTFASLPSKLKYGFKTGGNWTSSYLYGSIDLLIVDEAGQVSPEVALPSFALAKRALVIGDTQQLEPVADLSEAVDIGNLQRNQILDEDHSETDLTMLSEAGMRSLDGNVMRMAQQACAYAPFPDLERGLYLFEHRRCYDEIINFSNTLCYQGSLQPVRGAAPKDGVLPPMGYIHIDGLAVRYGGSCANATEAATIADWLFANRDKLESHYGEKLEDIVGLVTPFGRQVQELKRACADRGIDRRITIGTVHSLQGAERPIIMFSPVYSKHADGGFIDMSPSMLNVTVSRAKDSFLVFGDMDVLSSAALGTPRAVLGDLLFSSEGRELKFAPQARADLQVSVQSFTTLRDAKNHDQFMLEALASPAREYTIVSPWIVARTLKRVGLLDAFQNAVSHGAHIDVFVDPLLNQKDAGNGQTQLEAARDTLTRVGVTLHEVRQLHSKIFIVGADQLCIGSYNWLSADRDGPYARHETSIAYSGSHLEKEISLIQESLGAREKR